MTDEQLGLALGDMNEKFVLQAIETPEKKRKKWGKKFMVLVAAVVSLNSLVGYHTGYKLQYFMGGYYAKVSTSITPEGYNQSSSSLSVTGDAPDPYVVEDGQIYFTHDDSYRNITEYCSVNDCFLYNNVNFWGNGYIIVVGGTVENAGYLTAFFSGGRFTSSHIRVKSELEYDDYYTGFHSIYREHQWEAAINYELNIRNTEYINYFSEEDKWEYVDSQKPYTPYTITVQKA